MEDLADAIYCLEEQMRTNTYEGQRIGRIREGISDLGLLRAGEVVLFREELSNPYRGYVQTSNPQIKRKLLIIERPMTPEQIKVEKKAGSLLTTDCVTTGVYPEYIEDLSPELQRRKEALENKVI